MGDPQVKHWVSSLEASSDWGVALLKVLGLEGKSVHSIDIHIPATGHVIISAEIYANRRSVDPEAVETFLKESLEGASFDPQD